MKRATAAATDEVTFRLDQLLLANQLMLPVDYERLIRRYSDMSELELEGAVHRFATHHADLLGLLRSIPRSDKDGLRLLGAIINDLLSGR